MTDKLKRYVLPNLPYLLIFWLFLKLGTAYRIAEGADFGQKLIGLFQSIGPAFGTIAPGLHGFDWLIGLLGAAAVRLFVYCKTKNAKKFRRDAEYGSARWGTAKDIKPFIDPVFQNNIILTGTEFLTMNTRPKNPANARNLNCCVIGSSGSGKTRFWLTPQLLQAHSSYVVVDPKGGILGQVGAFLTRQGYTIKVFNSILRYERPIEQRHYGRPQKTEIGQRPVSRFHGQRQILAAKRELINVFLTTQDRIIVVDPMGEYAPLVERLGGQVLTISPDNPLRHYINPMDIQLDAADAESALSMKADFLLSLCELILGGKEGLQPIEKTVIDRCVRLVYRELALGIGDGKMPLLQDLYTMLCEQPEPEARRIATALELYCTGSLNLFNHFTNVSVDNRVVCVVLKGMGENLRKIAMHIVNELVTQAVSRNFAEGRATWCYFDEFHILLQDTLSASYFVRVWKMLRKMFCVPSALTQNVKDLLSSREIENILENSDFMILLAQAAGDRAILAKQLGISEYQLSYISHSHPGEGLLFYGSTTIPFVDRFPPGEIYNLLTTRPEDVAKDVKHE